jgi:hypothetical protein
MAWVSMALGRARLRAMVWSVAGGAVMCALVAQRLERPAIAAQQPAVAIPTDRRAGVDRDELMRVVRTLSSPDLQGRRTGSPGGLAARRFIRDAFQTMGLVPAVTGFLQPFSFISASVPGVRGRAATSSVRYDDAANVAAQVAGTRLDTRAIVVSAHYDHVGVRDGVIYPGADDNASGVAALLAIAGYVRQHPLQHRVVLAAFDAEEFDLQGAKAFLKAPPVPVSAMALNVNFDMVSRNDRGEIYAAGTYHSPSLKPIVADVQRRTPVKIRFGHDRPQSSRSDPEDWTPQSDHGEFHKAGVPFLYFGVDDHPDYHRPTDTADKIDPQFFGDVVDMLLDFVVTADRQLR